MLLDEELRDELPLLFDFLGVPDPERPAPALDGEVRQRRLLFGAAAVSALAEPLGAMVGLLAVTARPELNAWLLAFAAGAMLYVAVHELIPMAREHGHPKVFAIGAAASVAVFLALRLLIDTLS